MCGQQNVAGGVAQRVVHGLEAVDVDEQQGQATAVVRRRGRRGPGQLAKQRAVGQPGQVVVQGDLLPFRLLRPPLLELGVDLLVHVVETDAKLAELIAPVPALGPHRRP